MSTLPRPTTTTPGPVTEEEPFDVHSPIGILDPEGKQPNPLTGRPYQNLYANDGKNNKTYAELSSKWTSLGVYKRHQYLLETMRDHQIVVAKSGTGTGKTVLFPKLALHVCGYKQKVLCAVPKKIIASDHAMFASVLLDVEVGKQVGYRYKGAPRNASSAKHSMLEFATTGTVTAMMQGDPKLSQYGYLVIDEAHERSMGMDKLLSLVKELVQLRSDIRVMIMSATIELDMYRRFLPQPKYDMACVEVKSDPPFPRELVFLNKPIPNGDSKEGMIAAIVKQVMHILRTKPLLTDQKLRQKIIQSIRKNKPEIVDPESEIHDRDIIVFVPSASYATMICKEVDALRKKEQLENVMCLTLESKSEEQKVWCKSGDLFLSENGDAVDAKTLATDESLYKSHPDNDPKDPFKRKLVVSTAVAESSVTIDGATYVIDTAMSFSSFFQHKSQLTETKLFRVAQDAILQRQGRVGRTSPGIAYHLYTKKEFDSFDKMTTPDFQKDDLSADVLSILSMPGKDRIRAVRSFYNEMLEPPKEDLFQSACRVLRGASALTLLKDPLTNTPTPENDTRTMLGRAMSLFRGSFSVAQAKSLVLSEFYDCSREMAHICAMLQSCQGKSFATLLMKTPKGGRTPHPVPMRFVSQYGDHLTLLHIYQHFHYVGQRHVDKGAVEEAKKAFCSRHNMNYKFMETVEELSDKILRTLREKVFDNPDQTLLNLSDDDVLGNDALEQIRKTPLSASATTSTKFYKGRNPTKQQRHQHGGSFTVTADFSGVAEVNPSGELDLEVLYSLFPNTKRDIKAILKHITTDRQISLTSAEHARELLSEYIVEYKPRVFRMLTLVQQQAVVSALRRAVELREKQGATAKKMVVQNEEVTAAEAASEARGHEHWLQRLRVFLDKASKRVDQRQQAAEVYAERQVVRQKAREVIGKRHLYPPPADYFSPEWSNVEHRLLRALFEGHHTQIAVKVGAGRYRTTFPEKKVVVTIDSNSMLTSTYWKNLNLLQSHDVIIYDSITSMRDICMQNVSVLPLRARKDTTVQHMLNRLAGEKWDEDTTAGTKPVPNRSASVSHKNAIRSRPVAPQQQQQQPLFSKRRAPPGSSTHNKPQPKKLSRNHSHNHSHNRSHNRNRNRNRNQNQNKPRRKQSTAKRDAYHYGTKHSAKSLGQSPPKRTRTKRL